MAESKGTNEDMITVRCRRCREWLYSQTGPGRPRRNTTLKPVAGRLNGWCYCEGCFPQAVDEATAIPASTHGHRGYRVTDDRDRRRAGRGFAADYANEQAPGQEIGVRAMEDAAD